MAAPIGRTLYLSLCFCLALLDFWSVQSFAQDVPSAEKALKSKDYDKVIELLSPSVEKLKRESLYLLAEAHSAKGSFIAAIKIYETALALHPKDAATKRRIGVEQVKMKKEKDAMATFREAIEMNPDYEPAYVDLGDLLEKRSMKGSSKMTRYDVRLLYEDLIKRPAIGPKPAYITKLCDLTTLDGQYDLSPKYCEQGIRLNPREPKNYVNLATTQKETGKPEEAKKTYQRAADSFAKSELAQLSMGEVYAEEKNFPKAYVYFKRATDANPSALKAWHGLAQSSLELQKFEESHKALSHACDLNRSSTTEVRKALKFVTMQKNAEWTTKFDRLLDSCGIKKD